jgi:hypothetical protein
VELAVGWGWHLGPLLSFGSEPGHLCEIYAARRGPSKRPKRHKKPEQPKKADRLRRGRPREYDHDDIANVAEDLIKGGVDSTLDDFVGRVRSKLELDHKPAPKDTVLNGICAPIYKRERSKQ